MSEFFTIKNIISNPFYTEGPVIDKEGNFFFTTLSGGAVMKKSVNGRMSIWATSACPNGQIILPGGDHLVCDSKLSAIIRFDHQGIQTGSLLNGFCAGEEISVPNDLIIDSTGNIFFTDSIRHAGKIGFICIDGRERIIASELDYPNGLALSNDERTLYVAESYKNRIVAFNIENLHNSLQEKQEHMEILWELNLPRHPSGKETCNLPDGLKVDRNNNLFIAHYGMGLVHIYSPEKTLIQSIQTPFPLTSNLYIKNNTLIITGGKREPGPGGLIETEFNSEYKSQNQVQNYSRNRIK